MKLSLCVPMYNEAAIVKDAIATYTEALDRITGGDYELVLCDDGSCDGCGDIARAVAHPKVKLVGYPQNRGKGCAVRTAVMAAEGDLILCTDCDNAYGTDKIAQVLAIFDAEPEADIVIGSRNLDKSGYDGYTFLRKLASKTYILVLKIAAGLKYSDSQCGFKAYRKKAAHEIFCRAETDRFAFDIEVLLFADRFGFKVREMPVSVINHREAESKVNMVSDTLEMLGELKRIKKHVKNA